MTAISVSTFIIGVLLGVLFYKWYVIQRNVSRSPVSEEEMLEAGLVLHGTEPVTKYTFAEFIAAIEGEDFYRIDPDNLAWAKRFVEAMPRVLTEEYHGGDCTKFPGPCPFCVYETLLSEYYEYAITNNYEYKE